MNHTNLINIASTSFTDSAESAVTESDSLIRLMKALGIIGMGAALLQQVHPHAS